MVDLRLFAEPSHLTFSAAGCTRAWLSKLTNVQDLLQDPRDDFFFHFQNLAQVSHIRWPFSLQYIEELRKGGNDTSRTQLFVFSFFFEFLKVFEILLQLVDVVFYK